MSSRSADRVPAFQISSLVSGGTAGSVLFVGTNGLLQQDNTNFFWDDADNYLKVAGLRIPAVGAFSATSPGIDLSVYNNFRIAFDDNGGSRGWIRYKVDSAGTTIHGHVFCGANTDLVYIRSDGKTGFGTMSPHSTVHANGPIATAISTKTAAYTVTATDSVIMADASSGAFTVTLPTPVGIDGRQYTVKRINATNNVTIGTAAGTIDGAATYVLSTQYQSATLVSDGANWFII